MGSVVASPALFDNRWRFVLDPLLVILSNGQAFFIELRFNLRLKFVGFVTVRKPLQIIERLGLDLFGDLQRFTFSLYPVLRRIPPPGPLPKLPPVPVEAKS